LVYVEGMDPNRRLLHPAELDQMLGYPQGRSARLARRRLIPFVELPDGEIRFDRPVIQEWLKGRATTTPEVPQPGKAMTR